MLAVIKGWKFWLLTLWRLPVEIIRPGRYMKIKSKHSWWSENRRFIAAVELFPVVVYTHF
jgi:hypothetical protein